MALNSEKIKILRDSGELFRDYRELTELQHLYNSAIKEIRTKLDILSGEFEVKYERNPIHHIESRLKSTGSIINKLNKRGYEISAESAKRNLNDIAGIRVVCCYINDVYSVSEMLLRQSDLRLVDMKDYIKEPNYNGYRSLHLDVEVPIYLAERTENVTVEIQLRTVAMDFWASLEHDLRYKSDKNIPREISEEMRRCSDEIAEIDRRMQDMYKKIREL